MHYKQVNLTSNENKLKNDPREKEIKKHHGAQKQKKAHSFQMLKENCQLKISFRNEAEIKTFSDEGTLREFVISRPTLRKKMAKESSLNLGNVKRKNLETSGKGEVTETAKKWVDFPSPPEYSIYV